MSVRQQMNTFFASLLEQTGTNQAGQVVNTPMGPFSFNPLTQTWTNVNNGMKMSNMEFQFSMYGMAGNDYITSTGSDGGTQPAWTPSVPPNYIATLDFNFGNINGTSLSPYITYQRSGIAYSPDGFGNLVLKQANEPRFYQKDVIVIPPFNSSTPRLDGVLLEPERTNYVYNCPLINPSYGDTFTVNAWTQSATGTEGAYTAVAKTRGYTASFGFLNKYGPDGITQAYFFGLSGGNEKLNAIYVEDGFSTTDYRETFYNTLRYKTSNSLDTSKPITVSFYIRANTAIGPYTTLSDPATGEPNPIGILPTVPTFVNLEINAGVGVNDTTNKIIIQVPAQQGQVGTLPNTVQAGAYSVYYPFDFEQFTSATAYPANGTPVETQVSRFEKDWKRFFVTFIRTAAVAGAGANQSVELVFRTPTNQVAAASSDSLGVDIWGVQIEQGNFPTSLIPTGSAPETRGKDVLKISGISQAVDSTNNLIYLASRRFGAELTGIGSVAANGVTYSDIMKAYVTEGTSMSSYIALGNYVPTRGNTNIGGTVYRQPQYFRMVNSGATTAELAVLANMNGGGTYQNTNNQGKTNAVAVRYKNSSFYTTGSVINIGAIGITSASNPQLSGNTLSGINLIDFNPQKINAVGIERIKIYKGITGDIEMQDNIVSVSPTVIPNTL